MFQSHTLSKNVPRVPCIPRASHLHRSCTGTQGSFSLAIDESCRETCRVKIDPDPEHAEEARGFKERVRVLAFNAACLLSDISRQLLQLVLVNAQDIDQSLGENPLVKLWNLTHLRRRVSRVEERHGLPLVPRGLKHLFSQFCPLQVLVPIENTDKISFPDQLHIILVQFLWAETRQGPGIARHNVDSSARVLRLECESPRKRSHIGNMREIYALQKMT